VQQRAREHPAVVMNLSGVLGTKAAKDVDLGAFCGYPEYNHWAAEAEGATAEVVAVVSLPLVPSACPLIESAVRMGYNVTLLTIKHDHGWVPQDKQRLTVEYGRMRRAELLASLGKAPDDQAVLIKHLQAQGTAAHLYVGVDAFDVIVQLSPRELHKKWQTAFPKLPAFIVSGEANLYPLRDVPSNLAKFPDYPRALFPFPNSGLWVSRLDAIVDFLEECRLADFPMCAINPIDDQCKLMGGIIKHNFEYPCDSNGTILQNMHEGLNPLSIFDAALFIELTPEGMLRRRDTETTPVVIHWNGSTKDDLHYGRSKIVPYAKSNYFPASWMRRRQLDGSMPLGNFHVAFKTLQEHLSIFDRNMNLDPDGARLIMELCFK